MNSLFHEGRVWKPQTQTFMVTNACDQVRFLYYCVSLDHTLEAVVLLGQLNCFLFSNCSYLGHLSQGNTMND